MHYNFCRIHQTTRATPAMAAGVSEKLWDLIDVAKMVDDWERGQLAKPEWEIGGSISYAQKDLRNHDQKGRTRK